jgi:DNA excision repair protein ERCC-2
VDSGCRRLTASWTRERAARDASVELCDFYERHEAAGQDALLPPGGAAGVRAGGGWGLGPKAWRAAPPDAMRACSFVSRSWPLLLPPPTLHTGVYTLHDLRAFGRKQGWCPYFLARHVMAFANVIVYNYQYMIDPKVSQVRGGEKRRRGGVGGGLLRKGKRAKGQGGSSEGRTPAPTLMPMPPPTPPPVRRRAPDGVARAGEGVHRGV